MKLKGKIGVIAGLIVILVVSLSLFTVDQTQQAIVIQMGKITIYVYSAKPLSSHSVILMTYSVMLYPMDLLTLLLIQGFVLISPTSRLM